MKIKVLGTSMGVVALVAIMIIVFQQQAKGKKKITRAQDNIPSIEKKHEKWGSL
ncbi:hypothetical protein ABID30_001569 [Enterococcus rotai]|uniref:hypothetical protein n=1 Tax=Enterococcus rotai TaxID=118060 RepID=UPI000A5D54F3|nr:hypothetical protein [Enterococcus rotai]